MGIINSGYRLGGRSLSLCGSVPGLSFDGSGAGFSASEPRGGLGSGGGVKGRRTARESDKVVKVVRYFFSFIIRETSFVVKYFWVVHKMFRTSIMIMEKRRKQNDV